MMMAGKFLSRSTMRDPRSTIALSHVGLDAGTTALFCRPGSKPCVSRLASSTR